MYLSKKKIPPEERLIFALDVPSVEEALQLVDELGHSVKFYKLGLELFMAGGYYELIRQLRERGKKIFADLKFFDVPETVGRAVRQLKSRGVTFATVHGNDRMLEAAVREKGEVKILAVTVLTSHDQSDYDDITVLAGVDQNDLNNLSIKVNVKSLVLSRAERALKIGCDGVISSGLEAPALRKEFGEKFIIVTPGIRAEKNVDDQIRTVNVEEAFKNGADYIVVGRPIKNAPNRKAIAEDIQKRIAAIFTPTNSGKRKPKKASAHSLSRSIAHLP